MDIHALEVRQQVYEFVQRFPGTHFREIQRRMGMPVGSLQYHLSQLVKDGLVIKRKSGEYTRYYPVGWMDDKGRRMMSLLRNRNIRRMVIVLLEKKALNHRRIMESVNLSPATVSWYLNKLVEEGVVVRRKKGRESYYSLKEPDIMVRLLVTYKESFLDKMVERFAGLWER